MASPDEARKCSPPPFGLRRDRLHSLRERSLERETGIEPATNSLEGCDSTTELLPLAEPSPGAMRTGSFPPPDHTVKHPRQEPAFALRAAACQSSTDPRAKAGGEGRIRTSEATWATDLQSVAFDRSATSPNLLPDPSAARAWRANLARRHRQGLLSPSRWSWRRDLNPRPADYKSAALPG